MVSTLSQQSIEKYLPQYRNSLCGLASLANAINSLRQDNQLTPALLAKIYLNLISFDGQELPNPWRVFIPGDTDIYQSALMTIAIAFGLHTQRFEASNYKAIDNPNSTASLIPFISDTSKVIISVKSSFTLPGSSGSHLVLLDSFDHQNTKSFTIVDPHNLNMDSSQVRQEINVQFLDTFFRGTGFIVSNQAIPQRGFTFVPFATGLVKPNTKPWPVFIPKEVVNSIRSLFPALSP